MIVGRLLRARWLASAAVEHLGGAVFGLGDLESAIIDVLWGADGPVKVREVLNQLAAERPLAYTTVMTVLDNLHRKGWVRRKLDGKAYLYWPALSREEAAARALRDVLEESGDPHGALMHFAGSASEEESTILRDALKRHRRQR